LPQLPPHIEELIRAGESETVEFKKTTAEQREAVCTVCGFSNNRGGHILIGVRKDGVVLGQEVSDKTIEQLSNEIQKIEPNMYPNVERIPLANGKSLIHIVVQRGQLTPYNYKGIVYRRLGNTTIALNREGAEQLLLERLHGTMRWENEPLNGWAIEDFDEHAILKTLNRAIESGRKSDPGTRNLMELLRGFGLVSRTNTISRAAAVLFGRLNRLEVDLIQCKLKVARFKGVDRTEFIDNQQHVGNAFDLIDKAETFVKLHNPIAGVVLPGKMERVDKPRYSMVAVREALANAFCHRDYSIGGGHVSIAIYDDRMEIISSGSLHFGLTVDDLLRPHESLPWNPLIANVFFQHGLIETWGRGTLKMVEASKQSGLPEPTFSIHSNSVIVRFDNPPEILVPKAESESLEDRLLTIIGTADFGLPLRDIMDGLSDKSDFGKVRYSLNTLKKQGKLIVTGHGSGSRWMMKNERKMQ
jgi:ATP-dependent DNA helicase RecG